MNPKNILIAGLPRSGTTWVGEVLSSAHNTRYIFEPDNESLHPTAWWGKRNVHRYPYLTSKDTAPDGYYQLWHATINGLPWLWHINAGLGFFLRRKITRKINYRLEAHVGEKCGYRYFDSNMYWVGSGITTPYTPAAHPYSSFVARCLLSAGSMGTVREKVIIKSVHSPLSLDWISTKFPLTVIVILRNPYSLFASYKRMKLPDGVRNVLFQPALQRDWSLYAPENLKLLASEPEDLIASQIMLMYKVIKIQAAEHPEWMMVSHDRLCVTPHDDYRKIFDALGLGWSETTSHRINVLNKQGTGFEPSRVSSQQPFKWKSELETGQQRAIGDWMDRFELRNFFREKVDLP